MKEKIEKYLAIRKKLIYKQGEYLRKLFKDNPHCHYCKVKTELYEDLRNRGTFKGVHVPDNMATIEHIYSTLNPKRYTVKYMDNIVLACNKCNQTKITEESIALPQEVKALLSNSPKPKNKPRALWLLEIGYFDMIEASKGI